MEELEESIRAAVALLRESRRGVALTGAGISTESGIPDFRGPQGLWKQVDAMKVASIEFFQRNPAEHWRFAAERKFTGAAPNAGHRALADLERKGKLRAVITQNVDGLHQQAGSTRVLELHGTTRTSHCLECGMKFQTPDVLERVRRGENPPLCPKCEGLIKSDTVLFGELLPREVLEEAMAECQRADLMLVLGSSLAVHPAAGLPDVVAEHGGHVILINAEATEKDWLAEVVIHGKIGDVLPRITESL
ncbi:MAG: NAD-dependent deacylase [Euryarchaeota archaeon]|nr:NAD-dependent deacylase [Euryarchaeota archaeon]